MAVNNGIEIRIKNKEQNLEMKICLQKNIKTKNKKYLNILIKIKILKNEKMRIVICVQIL